MSFIASAILATVLATPANPASPLSPTPTETRLSVALAAPPPLAHRFFDRDNLLLFSGVAAGRACDYFSTRHFRDKHLKEWLLDDKTVDNRPLFVAIEVAATALSVAASYALHRTGHHRLERWASILHATFATGGSIWNWTLPNGL
jgi:hypothetical protein